MAASITKTTRSYVSPDRKAHYHIWKKEKRKEKKRKKRKEKEKTKPLDLTPKFTRNTEHKERY